MARRGEIRLRRREVGALVGVRLRAGPQPEAESIQILFRSGRGMIPRRQAEIDPVHAMLRGEKSDLDQR